MENHESLKRKRTTQEERFNGFALSHVLISVIGFGIGLPVGVGLVNFSEYEWMVVTAIAGDVVLLLMYFFAGVRLAGKKQWSFPQRFREGVWAFFAPALIAWGWGTLVICSVYADSWSLLMLLFFGSAVFAFPSFVMVYLAMVFDLLLFHGTSLGLWVFLAGGLPPLLFVLGSLWGSRKQRVEAEEKQSASVKEDDLDV